MLQSEILFLISSILVASTTKSITEEKKKWTAYKCFSLVEQNPKTINESGTCHYVQL